MSKKTETPSKKSTFPKGSQVSAQVPAEESGITSEHGIVYPDSPEITDPLSESPSIKYSGDVSCLNIA